MKYIHTENKILSILHK